MEQPQYPFVPMLLETAAFPFDDKNFAFEVKYDGVRITARADGNGVALFNLYGSNSPQLCCVD